MEPTAKTPVLADKRLWLSVATILSLLLSRFLKIELDPEMLATLAVLVLGYVTNSAVKEAAVSKAQIAATTASAEVKTQPEAAAVLRGPVP